MGSKDLSPAEYRILVERAPLLVWRAATSMECDYFNETWLQFTGRSLEQELGNGWAEGVHPDDLARCLEVYTRHFARREPFEMEYRLRRADGEYRWILDRGAPFHDDAGGFQGYIGNCVDVTDRVEAQEALRRAHEAEIHQLRGFLPICGYCKRVRNDRDYWEQIESYVSERTEVLFSHGVCPECEQRALDAG